MRKSKRVPRLKKSDPREEVKEELERPILVGCYKDYGFSKLSESELIRYTMVKNILMTFFRSTSEDEIDPESVANKLFISELKEFDWKPEEY